MTDTQVRHALERATSHLSPPPDLLDRVRAGGRRRVVRRRTVLAGGLAVAVAGSAAGGWAITRPGGGGEPVASPLLDGPTRGDLRGDAAYLSQVTARMRAVVGRHAPVVGPPHVVWAGSTPAGPVALVTQRLRRQVVSEVGQIQYGMMAFVQPTGTGPRITSVETMVTETVNSPAVLVGPERDVLVVLDDGRRVQLSRDFAYTADGKVRRTFAPLSFAADGAAVVRLAPQQDRIRIALKPGTAGADPNVGLANLSELMNHAEPVWFTLNVRNGIAGPIASTAAPGAPGWPDLSGADYGDQWGIHRFPRRPAWYVYGTTPGGHRFVVQTLVQDDERVRLFRLETGGKPHFLGFADPAGPLPIQVRLPEKQGVLVATERSTLRYRTSSGSWLPVTGHAAVLPAAATEVEVTPPGGRPATVVLGG